MELHHRPTIAPVHDGYQQSASLYESASPSFNSDAIPPTVTGKMSGPGTVGEVDTGTERLKLLQLKTPSYSTTVDMPKGPVEHGIGESKPIQESFEVSWGHLGSTTPLETLMTLSF